MQILIFLHHFGIWFPSLSLLPLSLQTASINLLASFLYQSKEMRPRKIVQESMFSVLCHHRWQSYDIFLISKIYIRKKDSPKFKSIHEIYWGENNQSQKLHKSNKNLVSKGVVIPNMDLMIEDVYSPYKLHWLMDINNVLVPQQCNNVLYQFTFECMVHIFFWMDFLWPLTVHNERQNPLYPSQRQHFTIHFATDEEGLQPSLRVVFHMCLMVIVGKSTCAKVVGIFENWREN